MAQNWCNYAKYYVKPCPRRPDPWWAASNRRDRQR